MRKQHWNQTGLGKNEQGNIDLLPIVERNGRYGIGYDSLKALKEDDIEESIIANGVTTENKEVASIGSGSVLGVGRKEDGTLLNYNIILLEFMVFPYRDWPDRYRIKNGDQRTVGSR